MHVPIPAAKLPLRIALVALCSLCAATARAQASSGSSSSAGPPPATLSPYPPSLAPQPPSPSTLPPPAAVQVSPPRPSLPRTPWWQGISSHQKAQANKLFKEARDLHQRMMLAEARAKYEEALTVLEHPGLRFYLARVLELQRSPLEAYENYRLALRWGPGSLARDKEQAARAALRALMDHDLAVIAIRCNEPGATVLLDGKPWFVGPGAERRVVMPGEHVVTVTRDGYSTVVTPILVVAGREASGQLVRRVETVVAPPPLPTWLPWAVLGAGATLGAAGGGLMASGNAESGSPGRVVAIGAIGTGVAIAFTGTVLLLANRPKAHRIHDRGEVNVELQPILSPGATGLSARLVF